MAEKRELAAELAAHEAQSQKAREKLEYIERLERAASAAERLGQHQAMLEVA